MTLRFALPFGEIRAMRFFRSGRTACRRTSMPAEFAMSWRNSDTLSSPVKSGRLGSKVGLMLGRATNSRSRSWTGERRGICRSFRICGQGQARTMSYRSVYFDFLGLLLFFFLGLRGGSFSHQSLGPSFSTCLWTERRAVFISASFSGCLGARSVSSFQSFSI